MPAATSARATEETSRLDIRSSRAIHRRVLAVGCVALALAAGFEWFRAPYVVAGALLATLLGARGALDRRPVLSISPDGIRYARWGGAVFPWEEFAGFRRVSWRSLPQLQLVPRQASLLAERLSPLGRVEQLSARLLRAPSFALAVTPLEIDEAALVRELGKHLAVLP